MDDRPFAAARWSAPAAPTPRRPTGPTGALRAAVEQPVLLTPQALLSSLFSFEALLVLYMYSGVYKSHPRFSWLPADPTGLFFVLSVLVGSFIIVRQPIYKKSLPIVFAMICLLAWLWVGLMWSPSEIYGPSKLLEMTTLTLWALIAGALIVAPDPDRIRRLFTLMLLLAVWGGADAVLTYVESGGGSYRYTTVDGEEISGHLLLGRTCGPGALVAFVGWLYSRSRAASWLYMAVFLALCFALAVGGGRGPLISTAVALLIPIGLAIRFTKRKIRYFRTLLSALVLLVVAIAGLALYGTLGEQGLPTFDRLNRLAERGNPRSELYAEWIRLWPQAPLLGHGTGSWPLLVDRLDRTRYPHNLFLELLVENGLVGLALFGALVGAAFRAVSLERLRRDPQALCAMMVLASTLSNAMTTGDLPGNRAVFMMLGVLALFAVRSRPAVPAAGLRHRIEPFLQLADPATRNRGADLVKTDYRARSRDGRYA